MRKLLLVVALVLTAAMPVHAQDDGSAAIIDKALKAIGGADKAAGLKATTARAKGSVNFMDLEITFTLEAFSQEPSKTKSIVNITVMDQRIEIVKTIDGDKGWESTNGDLKDLADDDIKQYKDEKYIESVTNLFGLKTDKAFKFSPLGETKVGDTACVGVQVTKKDKRDVNLYFDKKTNLLIKAEYRGPHLLTKEEVTMEKFYSDYKELVPGLKTASKVVINVDGAKFMEMEMLEIRTVERHDDSIFARPK